VHRKAQSYKNRIRNGSFEDRLTNWNTAGAYVVTAEEGHLVHTGTQAVALSGANAFITQTVPAGRGARLQFSAHIRGVGNQTNSPLVVRLRWVDASGSFLGTALEIFIPQKQLAQNAWMFLWENTNLAPSGTAGVNIRVDAPYSEGEAATVLDDLVVR
jgi:hypothetical protein